MKKSLLEVVRKYPIKEHDQQGNCWEITRDPANPWIEQHELSYDKFTREHYILGKGLFFKIFEKLPNTFVVDINCLLIELERLKHLSLELGMDFIQEDLGNIYDSNLVLVHIYDDKELKELDFAAQT